MMVMGMRVSPLALMVRNMIIASEAVSFLGLRVCSSFIVCSPNGVAALSSPSRLALKFISMVPSTGAPLGRVGKMT